MNRSLSLADGVAILFASPAIADLISSSIGRVTARVQAGGHADEEAVMFEYLDDVTAHANWYDHTTADAQAWSGPVGDAARFEFSNSLLATYYNGSNSGNDVDLAFALSEDAPYDLRGALRRGSNAGVMALRLGLYQMVDGSPVMVFRQEGSIDMSRHDRIVIGDDTYCTIEGSPTGQIIAGEGYFVELSIEVQGRTAAGNSLVRLTFGSAPCIADFNSDAQVDILDVLIFLNAWRVGDLSADLNADGSVDALDVLFFLNEWAIGC